MSSNQTHDVRMMVFSSLFTVLIIIGGYISIPIPPSPVPIVLSDFFALLAGLFLGPKWGGASVGLFLFTGALGLPVFAGGKAGLVILFGPTGGYLFGFLMGAFAAGLISGKGKPGIIKDLSALLAGNILLYSAGVLWLKTALRISWSEGLLMGLLPFIPGIAIKIIVSILLLQAMRPFLKQITDTGDFDEHT